jgi:3',5'-cyclic AMP phosphodiesterase CpdA
MRSILLLFFLSLPFAFSQDITLAVAGDIACAPGETASAETCQMMATSELIVKAKVDAVLALGDEQYPGGSLEHFKASYDLSWGKFKDKTYPAIGNHEYGSLGAGYFNYFGAVAGEWNKGYYSFDLGSWHLIALNSNCWAVGGCGETSGQVAWLQDDLRTHSNPCTLAFWHHPRFSSGPHGNDDEVATFWDVLQAANTEIILNGHDHLYERFAPQRSDGTATSDGIRQFTVGTGGKELYRIKKETSNREFVNDRNFGVLFLTLRDSGYAWEFKTITGETLDAGEGNCR